jgi:hypothetical protein
VNLKNLAGLPPLADFGETHYVVDGDYRTIAQGWAKADGTGPLDLWAERNPNRVFYVGSGISGARATDAAAWQAAIDAAVDFRGDKILGLPGSFSIATALTVDCAGLRIQGPPVRNPRRAALTMTDAIGKMFTVSADDVELAHMKVVPVTADEAVSISDGADGGYIHNVFYSTVGVTANTGTEFVNAAATTSDWLVENCYFLVSGLQGDCFTWATATRWLVRDSIFHTMTASYASVFTLATSCVGNIVQRCVFGGDADGTYTNIFTGAANENAQLYVLDCRVSGTTVAGTSVETGFGTTTDIEYAENFLTGDATTEGGALIVLA